MLTLRSVETFHPRMLSSATPLYRKLKSRTLSTCDVTPRILSSATPLYRKLESRTLSTCDVTHVAYLDFGSKGVSVETVNETCILVKSFRTRNAVTRNVVPCSAWRMM
jgi:hypothetical protein